MSKALFIAALALTAAACTSSEAREEEKVAATKAAATAANVTTASTGSRTFTAPSGTRIDATITQELSSRTSKPGELIRTTVSSDIRDARGNIVIPSGSTLTLTIDKMEPGSDQARPLGRLLFNVTSVTIRGEEVPIDGKLSPVTHRLVDRGITTPEATRVAYRDVVVSPGTDVFITLSQPLVVAAR
jgi:hypothetical protein